jgi:hypothetical protein
MVAQILQGESVLIHAPREAMRHAAIQIALLYAAKIFVTARAVDDMRALLTR